jgi:serine/threonine protein kinase
MKKKGIEDFFDFKSQGYEIGEKIGEGAFGKVFCCKKLDNEEVLAMSKTLDKLQGLMIRQTINY